MYEDSAGFFADGTPYPVDQADCLGTLKLLHAFYRSDEDGGWVDVDGDAQSSRLGCADEDISNLYRTPQP